MVDARAQELVDLLEHGDEQVRREFHPRALELRTLRADDRPALLEQVVAGDRVHPIEGTEDLERRLAPDRRVLTLVHPDLPDRLLAFVEVALAPTLDVDMPWILRSPVTDPAGARVAIFYSINRCERALAGLGIPTALLERVIPALGGELPGLDVFSTLSPIPALRQQVEATDPPLAAALDADTADRSRLLSAAVDLVTRSWEGRVRDRVAHFHLGNGARVERIRDGADPSPRGQQRSWGVMANYRYEPEELGARAEAYRRGEVAVAPDLR